MIRVLVVEDDQDLLDDLVFGLRHEGFETSGIPDGIAIEAQLASLSPDVLVLDVGLPGEDGFTIARKLGKTSPNLGIVMLTGRSTTTDRVVGLESGADIYLTKTAERRELVAAIRAVARRVAKMPKAEPPWTLDVAGMKLTAPDGIAVTLTGQELRLMQVFSRAYGGEATRRKLIEGLGHNYLDFDERRLETLVSRLRRKITEHCGDREVIRTLRAEGYLFTATLQAK